MGVVQETRAILQLPWRVELLQDWLLLSVCAGPALDTSPGRNALHAEEPLLSVGKEGCLEMKCVKLSAEGSERQGIANNEFCLSGAWSWCRIMPRWCLENHQTTQHHVHH